VLGQKEEGQKQLIQNNGNKAEGAEKKRDGRREGPEMVKVKRRKQGQYRQVN